MATVTKEQARDIFNYYSQIETAETLISELEQAVGECLKKDKHKDFLFDKDFHDHGSICITVPYFESGRFDKSKGSRVYNISYPSAIKVLKNHVKKLKRLLKETESNIN